jgi:hypothetical protein
VLGFVAAAAGGRVNGPEGGVIASILAVFAFYVTLGAWQRRVDASVAVAAASIPALVLASLSAAPWLVEFAYGAGLIAAGSVLRTRTGRA